jgi:hypothetical protein
MSESIVVLAGLRQLYLQAVGRVVNSTQTVDGYFSPWVTMYWDEAPPGPPGISSLWRALVPMGHGSENYY